MVAVTNALCSSDTGTIPKQQSRATGTPAVFATLFKLSSVSSVPSVSVAQGRLSSLASQLPLTTESTVKLLVDHLRVNIPSWQYQKYILIVVSYGN